MATPAIQENQHLCDISAVSLDSMHHLRGSLNIYKYLMWSLGSSNSGFAFQIRVKSVYTSHWNHQEPHLNKVYSTVTTEILLTFNATFQSPD